MTPPHDFEFQFGRHRAVKGRGWRGLVALALVAMCFTMTIENMGTGAAGFLTGRLANLISAPKIPK
jgi:hypothetical protein